MRNKTICLLMAGWLLPGCSNVVFEPDAKSDFGFRHATSKVDGSLCCQGDARTNGQEPAIELVRYWNQAKSLIQNGGDPKEASKEYLKLIMQELGFELPAGWASVVGSPTVIDSSIYYYYGFDDVLRQYYSESMAFKQGGDKSGFLLYKDQLYIVDKSPSLLREARLVSVGDLSVVMPFGWPPVSYNIYTVDEDQKSLSTWLEVEALGGGNFSGGGFHLNFISEKNDKCYIFGVAEFGHYVEVFCTETGVNCWRFRSDK